MPFTVTAEDGVTEKSYDLYLLCNRSVLDTLEVSENALTADSLGNYAYTVPTDAASIKIHAVADHELAKVSINGNMALYRENELVVPLTLTAADPTQIVRIEVSTYPYDMNNTIITELTLTRSSNAYRTGIVRAVLSQSGLYSKLDTDGFGRFVGTLAQGLDSTTLTAATANTTQTLRLFHDVAEVTGIRNDDTLGGALIS